MTTPERRLAELGIDLPEPAAPVAAYAPTARMGSSIHVSGQLPLSGGKLLHTGIVGRDVDEAAAVACARQCAIGILAQLRAAAGSLDAVRVVRVGVFVASDPAFTDQHKVANGASELLGAVFGQEHPHARAAVGVSSLPLNAPVEVDALAEIFAA